jgi:hypothetical protein
LSPFWNTAPADYPIQVATSGLRSQTMSWPLQAEQSYAIHTVNNHDIPLISIPNSASTASSRTELIKLAQGHLMGHAMYRSFGVSAHGALAYQRNTAFRTPVRRTDCNETQLIDGDRYPDDSPSRALHLHWYVVLSLTSCMSGPKLHLVENQYLYARLFL